MKLHEAKQARSEALKRSHANGDRVEQIMQEADAVEGEVQKMVRRFSQRLKRYQAKLIERANGAATGADIEDEVEAEDEAVSS